MIQITGPIQDYRQLTGATPLARLGANFIDGMVAVLVSIVPSVIAGLAFGFATAFVTGFCITFGYTLFKDALPFLNGQSLGKQLLNIIVIDSSTGTTIKGNYSKAFVRQLFRLIPLVNIIDALMIFDAGKRLGDTVAGTEVKTMPR